MSGKCSVEGCYAPEVSCVIGEPRHQDCPSWNARADAKESASAEVRTEAMGEEYKFPWTGNALGPMDAAYVGGATKTRVVALVGAAAAGKTSLLAAFYLLIARGIRPDGVDFAGSLTLEGWENIASSLRWSKQFGPAFPPHTPSGAGRQPGLLHLTLKQSHKYCDLLAADAPGEWFTAWASNKSGQQAEGARWIAERSDVFLVIADSEALAGPQRGEVRGALMDLLMRVGGERGARPVALVWTKCDKPVNAGVRQAIMEAAKRHLVEFKEFKVSLFADELDVAANQGTGIVDLMQWILTARSGGLQMSVLASPERALFAAYGRSLD